MKKLFLVLLVLVAPPGSAATLKFVSGFETGAIQSPSKTPDGWGIQNGGLPNATVVKCDPKPPLPMPRSGRCMVQFNLVRAEWTGAAGVKQGTLEKPRAQLKKEPEGPIGFKQHVEYWIGISTFHPLDWQFESDKTASNQIVFWQMHGFRGTEGKSPPLALDLQGKSLSIVNRSGEQFTKTGSNAWTNAVLWKGALELGKWTDWIVRVRWEQTGTTGYVQVWRNGVLIAERLNKPTLYYTTSPSINDLAYQLLSAYKGKWASGSSTTTKHTLYYDAIRIAEGASGKDLVDPAKNP